MDIINAFETGDSNTIENLLLFLLERCNVTVSQGSPATPFLQAKQVNPCFMIAVNPVIHDKGMCQLHFNFLHHGQPYSKHIHVEVDKIKHFLRKAYQQYDYHLNTGTDIEKMEFMRRQVFNILHKGTSYGLKLETKEFRYEYPYHESIATTTRDGIEGYIKIPYRPDVVYHDASFLKVLYMEKSRMDQKNTNLSPYMPANFAFCLPVVDVHLYSLLNLQPVKPVNEIQFLEEFLAINSPKIPAIGYYALQLKLAPSAEKGKKHKL